MLCCATALRLLSGRRYKQTNICLTRSGNYSTGLVAAVVTQDNAQEILQSRTADGSSTVGEKLAQHVAGVDCLPLSNMNTALILPWPSCHLIARGRWQSIALSSDSRWPKSCSASKTVRLWRRYELADNEPSFSLDPEDELRMASSKEDLFQPQRFQVVADFLRDNASYFSSSSHDKEGEKMRIASYAQFLEQCVGACSEEGVVDSMHHTRSSRGGWYTHQLGRRVEYFSEFFVKVLCLSLDLRSDHSAEGGSYVKRTFSKAIKLMPPELRNLLEYLYNSTFFPSQSTISRASLYIDVMKVMCERHEALIAAKAFLYSHKDASPQGGRLYQITEYFSFGGGGDGLIVAGRATCRLRSFSKQPEQISEKDLQTMTELMEIIRSAKGHHIFPPHVYGC